MANCLKRIKIRYVLLLAVFAAILFFALPARPLNDPAEIEYLRVARSGETSHESLELTGEQEAELRTLLSQTAFRRTLRSYSSNAATVFPFEIEVSFHYGQKPFHLPVRADAGLCYSSSDDLIQYSVIASETLLTQLEEILE